MIIERVMLALVVAAAVVPQSAAKSLLKPISVAASRGDPPPFWSKKFDAGSLSIEALWGRYSRSGSMISRNVNRLKSVSRVQICRMRCSRVRIAVWASWNRLPARCGNSTMSSLATSA